MPLLMVSTSAILTRLQPLKAAQKPLADSCQSHTVRPRLRALRPRDSVGSLSMVPVPFDGDGELRGGRSDKLRPRRRELPKLRRQFSLPRVDNSGFP